MLLRYIYTILNTRRGRTHKYMYIYKKTAEKNYAQLAAAACTCFLYIYIFAPRSRAPARTFHLNNKMILITDWRRAEGAQNIHSAYIVVAMARRRR